MLASALDEPDAPVFPPLLRGERSDGDPFAAAVARARAGADPGLVVWAPPAESLRAAMVLAPEDPLERALGVFLAAPLALSDALAMLAPPEVAVQYRWPSDVLVNGALCARCRASAGGTDPSAVPDWLVIGVEVGLRLPPGMEGGERPDQTCLAAEGCGEVAPLDLLERWSRHMIVWINRWTDNGMAPLLATWQSRAVNIGKPMPEGGVFTGLDETGSMLVAGPIGTTRHPLTRTLQP